MQPKKLLTIILAVILTCFLAVSIFAAEDDPLTMAVEVSSSTAISNQSYVCQAGEEITVKITVKELPEKDISSYDFYVKYNSNAFELITDVKDESVYGLAALTTPKAIATATDGVGSIRFGYYGTDKSIGVGDYIVLKFKALDYHGGNMGAIDFKIENADFTLSDFNSATVKKENGVIGLHDFDEGVATEGTCQSEGFTTFTCQNVECKFSYDVLGEKKLDNHTSLKVLNKVEPDCVNTGLTEGEMCEACGVTTVEQTIVDALGHDFLDTVREGATNKATDATCTAKSTYYKACSRCDVNDTNTFEYGEPNGHAPETDEAVSATCTTTGLTEGSHCSVCNEVLVPQNTVDALGHDFTAKNTGNEYQLTGQSCTTPAEFYYSCSRVGCGISSKGLEGEKTFIDKEALGHDFTAEVVDSTYLKSEADCENSAVYYKSCKVCKISSKGEPQEATFKNGDPKGHKFDKKVVSTATVHTAATCTTDAIYYNNCSVCDKSSKDIDDTAVFTAINSALGHDFTATKAEEKYLKAAATCTTKAVYFKSCTRCGEKGTETFENGNALGHDFTATKAEEKYLKAAATCTTKAVYFKSCTRCGEKGTETFENGNALGHEFTATKAEEKYLKAAATCTTKATYYKSCTRCGEKGTETFENGEPLGHKFDKETATDAYKATDATCTDKATYYKSCSVCAETSKGASGEATFEHGELADHATEDLMKIEAVAPTCTETGLTEGEYCAKCTATTIEQETVAAKGHVLGDWVVEVEPKIGKEGKQTKTCNVCKNVIETEAIEAKSALPIILIIVAVVVVGGGVGTFFVLKNKKSDEEEETEDAE